MHTMLDGKVVERGGNGNEKTSVGMNVAESRTDSE